jgi:hypothetical protein
MSELFGKSLLRSSSGEGGPPTVAKRKLWAGAIAFGVGALLQIVSEYGHSRLVEHTETAELALTSIGMAVQLWGLVTWHFSCGVREQKH